MKPNRIFFIALVVIGTLFVMVPILMSLIQAQQFLLISLLVGILSLLGGFAGIILTRKQIGDNHRITYSPSDNSHPSSSMPKPTSTTTGNAKGNFSKAERDLEPATKKCPYCAKKIQREAIFCSYCRRDLSENHFQAEQESAHIAAVKQHEVERQARLEAEQEMARIAAEKQREIEAAQQAKLRTEQEVTPIAAKKQHKAEIERQARLNVNQEVAQAKASLEDDVGPDPDNVESKQAYALMKGSSPCVFITGKAGTGKSYLLKHFMQRTDKQVVLLAPTGMAAFNIGGQTIHSFFKFPPRIINLDEITQARERGLYRRVDTIVIDEVSMVNANLMDGIDVFMRKNGRDSSKPFGGAQIILFGDLFQLPPVVTSQADHEYFSFHYASEFFFDAHVFRELPIQIVELQKNYRQQDQTFIDVLNAVRTNQLTDSQQAILNSRYDPAYIPPEDDFFTVLTTTNKTANLINSRELQSLPSEEYTYIGELEGKFDEKSLPIDTVLKLKKGAQVMFAKNDAAGRWINGTFGKVVDLDKDCIEVEVRSNGHSFTYRAEREIWQNCRYKFDRSSGRITTEEIGRFLQYPLKLAWAITIHKSQGQTLDKVIIDLTGGVFEHGQVYVALSRCRTLEGMVLKTEIWKNDVLIVRSRVKEFMSQALSHAPVPEAHREPVIRAAILQQRASGVEPPVSGLRFAVSDIARLPFEPEMILIPAKEFLMGSDPNKDKNARDDEQPQHTLYLPDYYIAKTPMTNAQYAAFVQATGHRAPKHWQDSQIPQGKDMHPVVYVDWYDALTYCEWLAEVTGKFYTLPSEAEWEKAARGTDGRIYPWGNTFDGSKCNTFESDFDDMTPVEKYSRGASPYGVLDMAGNVWEWTRSQKQAYPYDPTDGREDASASAFRVLRGGSVLSDRSSARCAARDRDAPDHGGAIFGFRVAISSSSA